MTPYSACVMVVGLVGCLVGANVRLAGPDDPVVTVPPLVSMSACDTCDPSFGASGEGPANPCATFTFTPGNTSAGTCDEECDPLTNCKFSFTAIVDLTKAPGCTVVGESTHCIGTACTPGIPFEVSDDTTQNVEDFQVICNQTEQLVFYWSQNGQSGTVGTIENICHDCQ